jgi:polar amino acid transport system ATP-binding protein
MTVLGNAVEAPIRVRKLRRDEAMAIGEECLRRVQLIDKASEYPARLSGGLPTRRRHAELAIAGVTAFSVRSQPNG